MDTCGVLHINANEQQLCHCGCLNWCEEVVDIGVYILIHNAICCEHSYCI